MNQAMGAGSAPKEFPPRYAALAYNRFKREGTFQFGKKHCLR